MQTIEVTDAQHAFLMQLREELSREVVGRYGTSRECDAVQFLIDHLDNDGDLSLDVDADDGTTISFDGIDGELATPESGQNATDEPGDADGEDESGDADGKGTDADGEDPDDADEAADDDSADDASEDQNDGGAETGDDDAMLDKMMNLLDTHDEKWEESPAADYRYRVELPDGGTEDVQTKDDVKAILFREY